MIRPHGGPVRQVEYDFVLGDLRVTLSAMLARTGPPDYAYLDSYHNKEFGRFFQQELLSKMRPGSFVSAHDVYHSGFYSDDPKGQVRDMAAHPSDEPTEEGRSLVQWLAHTSRGEHVFTMSAHAKTPEHGWACSARGKVLDYSNTVRGNQLHEPDVDGCGGRAG